MNNYPPGVSGNEWQIAGYPPCGNCKHLAEDHDYDSCTECDCTDYTPYHELEEDPDAYEKLRDRYED